jgi:hypothetical protein
MVNEALAGRSLVDLARDGDATAFESLVRSRMDAMYRLGLAIRGDKRFLAAVAETLAVGRTLRASDGQLAGRRPMCRRRS